jgi:hypothetical protein
VAKNKESKNALSSIPALFLFMALTIDSAGALTTQRVEQPLRRESVGQQTAQHKALANEITQLFNEDQTLLAELEKAKKDPIFRESYTSFVQRIRVNNQSLNFYDPQIYALWAERADAPEVVRRVCKFRMSTDTRIQSIVSDDGWPQRASVGDEAAAEFFFLFGHADDNNTWRLSQLETIKRVVREDHVNPRMYAHLCDRLANVAGKPQTYGSVIGPGEAPGTARLYCPLIDTVAAADQRRAQIGLPSIEDDLEKFRRGANIGPYMTPLSKGMEWSLADVYKKD